MSFVRALAVVLPIVAIACANSGPADELTGQNGSTLSTPEIFPQDVASRACDEGEQAFIREAMRAGRIVAESPAFRACLGAAMIDGVTLDEPDVVGNKEANMEARALGAYDLCVEHGLSDPPESGSPDQVRSAQYGRVLAAARTHAPAILHCDPNVPANAAARADAVMDVGNGPEGWSYQKENLDTYMAQGNVGFTMAASWHEAMHQHGFHHATGAPEACGYDASGSTEAGDVSWMFRHTVPYIVEFCMWQVFEHSAEACADIVCDNAEELALDDAYLAGSAPVCRCFDDPATRAK